MLAQLLLALVTLAATARVLGAAARRLGQPAVIGEVAAGILLGPSLLGRVAPDLGALLFPPAVIPSLAVVAQLGVVLYMFLVGLDLDTTLLRSRPSVSLAVSQGGIAAPFALGAALALWLYPRHAPHGVSTVVFVLFIGVSMSVTALPVLSRILTDRGLDGTRLGAVALGCAAVADVTAWCLLALVSGLAKAAVGPAAVTVGLTAVFVAGFVLLVRPRLLRLVQRHALAPGLSADTFAVVCLGLLASALATEWIGVHALFGAFVFGAAIPHDSALARDVKARLESVVVVVMLPAFFASTGLRTQVGLVSTAAEWGVALLIVVVASVGKLGGSALAARAAGMAAREALELGILMNTRGLMELVALDVGMSLGILSPTLFTLLVLMALVTTFATGPLLDLLGRGAPVPDGARLPGR